MDLVPLVALTMLAGAPEQPAEPALIALQEYLEADAKAVGYRGDLVWQPQQSDAAECCSGPVEFDCGGHPATLIEAWTVRGLECGQDACVARVEYVVRGAAGRDSIGLQPGHAVTREIRLALRKGRWWILGPVEPHVRPEALAECLRFGLRSHTARWLEKASPAQLEIDRIMRSKLIALEASSAPRTAPAGTPTGKDPGSTRD